MKKRTKVALWTVIAASGAVNGYVWLVASPALNRIAEGRPNHTLALAYHERAAAELKSPGKRGYVVDLEYLTTEEAYSRFDLPGTPKRISRIAIRHGGAYDMDGYHVDVALWPSSSGDRQVRLLGREVKCLVREDERYITNFNELSKRIPRGAQPVPTQPPFPKENGRTFKPEDQQWPGVRFSILPVFQLDTFSINGIWTGSYAVWADREDAFRAVPEPIFGP